MDKPISKVPNWTFESDISYLEFPIVRLPTPFVRVENPDGTDKIIRVAPNEYGVRAWCVGVLDFFNWQNPADSVCAQPGLWRIDQEDSDELKKYFGDEFRLRPPNNFCSLDWGVNEAEDKVYYPSDLWWSSEF